MLQQTPVKVESLVMLTPAQRSRDRGDCIREVQEHDAQKRSSQKTEETITPAGASL